MAHAVSVTPTRDQVQEGWLIDSNGNASFQTISISTDTYVPASPGYQLMTLPTSSWITSSHTREVVGTSYATLESSAGIATTKEELLKRLEAIQMPLTEITIETARVTTNMIDMAAAWNAFVEAFKEQMNHDDAIMARAGAFSHDAVYGILDEKFVDEHELMMVKAGRR